MDGLDFSLRGFVVCYLLTYAAGILFAVLEGRRWNAAARTVPPAVVLIVFAPLIFPVVAHLVRPRLRARGVDARIVRLKLAIAWFVPVLAAAGLWLCGFSAMRSWMRRSPKSWRPAAGFRACSSA